MLAAVLLWQGWALAARNATVTTVTLPFPFAVVYAIVPAAAVLIILFALTRLARSRSADRQDRDRADALVLAIWLATVLAGVPIYLAMGLAGAGFAYLAGVPGVVVPQKIAMAANSFPLLAAPFFILMGNVMNFAGVTTRMFRFATVMVGWMRGGRARPTSWRA